MNSILKVLASFSQPKEINWSEVFSLVSQYDYAENFKVV